MSKGEIDIFGLISFDQIWVSKMWRHSRRCRISWCQCCMGQVTIPVRGLSSAAPLDETVFWKLYGSTDLIRVNGETSEHLGFSPETMTRMASLFTISGVARVGHHRSYESHVHHIKNHQKHPMLKRVDYDWMISHHRIHPTEKARIRSETQNELPQSTQTNPRSKHLTNFKRCISINAYNFMDI